jgi:hypothetical protein
MHAGKNGRQLGWPRCRWCHREIQNLSSTDPFIWEHVATGKPQCEGRSNMAEPIPTIHEEPFMEAAWEMVTRYRNLRRAFRDISTSRASAVRRMQDYQKLADELIDAYESPNDDNLQLTRVETAVKAIRDYRKTSQAAGWR